MDKKPILKSVKLNGQGFISFRIFFQFAEVFEQLGDFICNTETRDHIKEQLHSISIEVDNIWNQKKEYIDVLNSNIKNIDEALGKSDDIIRYADDSIKLHILFRTIIINSIITLNKLSILCGSLFQENIDKMLQLINYLKNNVTDMDILEMLESDDKRLKELKDIRNEFEHPKNNEIKLFEFQISKRGKDTKPLLTFPSIIYKDIPKRQINEYITECSINLFSFVEDILGICLNLLFKRKNIPFEIRRVLDTNNFNAEKSYIIFLIDKKIDL